MDKSNKDEKKMPTNSIVKYKKIRTKVESLILRRLAMIGVPEECIKERQHGLVRYVKDNNSVLADIVAAIIRFDVVDVVSPAVEAELSCDEVRRGLYCESMVWLKWLMFEGDPTAGNLDLGQSSVCGTVWDKDEVVFGCKTCGIDRLSTICVSCFRKGDHKNHKYFKITPKRVGRCDCGDETAWKREGFCSNHSGADQIGCFLDKIPSCLGLVIDAVFRCWTDKLLLAEAEDHMAAGNNTVVGPRMEADEFSYAVVEMLIELCSHNEGLLPFLSNRLIDIAGFLNLLARAERFLSIDVTAKLHKFLIKLWGVPIFKDEFAKVFVDYYPVSLGETLNSGPNKHYLTQYQLVVAFTMQIFTVPTLVLRLVKEKNLLAVLLEGMGEVLLSCCGVGGLIQFNKWSRIPSILVMQHIALVMSHSGVAEYVTHERPDIFKAWLQILSIVQGMDPLKTETRISREEKNETLHCYFDMVKLIARINLFLVKGAFFVATEEDKGDEASRRECNGTDDIFSQKLPNTGRLSEESPVCYPMARISVQGSESRCDGGHNFLVPSTVLQLTFELLTVIDCWLAGSSVVSHGSSDVSHCKEASAAVDKMQCILRSCDGSLKSNEHRLTSMKDTGLFSENDVFLLFSSPDWSDTDVSSQEISIHMPLHGLLSLILIEAMRNYHEELVIADQGGRGTDLDPLNALVSCNHGIFDEILRGCHPKGFSFFIMEHPLQRRVFCSQVCAGMWDKSSNGNAAEVCHELLYSNCWTNQELEIDLFVLQLCAAYAPADLYVKRMIQRFQLSSYLDLDFRRSNEYEPVLVQELITLIIQIVKERQFCGLTAAESLQKQLVCKLASGDASNIQLLKSLPVDLRKLDQFQKIVDEIAEKNEFDMYHPCWNPRDLAAANARNTRFCEVSALAAQVPNWSRTYKSFTWIANIATCKTTLNLIRAVLFYAIFTDTSVESRAPDGVLVRAMHLLSLALDICSMTRHCSAYDGNCSPFMVIATEEIEMGMHGRQSLLSLVVLLAKGSESGNRNVSLLAKTLLDKFDKPLKMFNCSVLLAAQLQQPMDDVEESFMIANATILLEEMRQYLDGIGDGEEFDEEFEIDGEEFKEFEAEYYSLIEDKSSQESAMEEDSSENCSQVDIAQLSEGNPPKDSSESMVWVAEVLQENLIPDIAESSQENQPIDMSGTSTGNPDSDFSFEVKPACSLKLALEAIFDLEFNPSSTGRIDIDQEGFGITVLNPNNITGYLRLNATGLQNFQCSKPMGGQIVGVRQIAHNFNCNDEDTVTVSHTQGSDEISFAYGKEPSQPTKGFTVQFIVHAKIQPFPEVNIFCQAAVTIKDLELVTKCLFDQNTEPQIVTVDITKDMAASIMVGQQKIVDGTDEMIDSEQRHIGKFDWTHPAVLQKAARLDADFTVSFTSSPENVMLRFIMQELGELMFLKKAISLVTHLQG